MTIMNFKTFYFGILVLALFLGCQKNDDSISPEIELQNEPPLSFNLLDVADNSTNVDVLPTLSWESAKNPAGSEVTYDLHLGKEQNPTNLYRSGITETTFNIDERLNLLADYYWKVVARDTDGMTSQSGVRKFTTRNLKIPAEPFVDNAGFAPRHRHSATVFDNKLWVSNVSSIAAENLRNDVWYRSNGEDWFEAKPSQVFPKRAQRSSVFFKSKLWVINGSEVADVWSFEDPSYNNKTKGNGLDQ